MPNRKITPAEIEKYLVLLSGTPRRIAASTAQLTDEQLHAKPGPREWSACEVLAHLRACDHVWTYSIYAMLIEDQPVLPLLDERRWAKAARYAQFDFATSLTAFSLQRAELVHVLRALPTEGWSRTANIAGRMHSIFSQVRRIGLHEVEHCLQFEARK